MKRLSMFKSLAATLLLSLPGFASALSENPRVVLETDLGNVELVLYSDKAPKTVENFLAYVDSGFYNGTIFHRVIPGFMAQGGGYTFDFQEKPTQDPIVNESANGLSNARGTIAMARTNEPDSATAQFFINLVDNSRLDGSADKAGYTVFGKVLLGMSVVQQIAAEPRGQYASFPDAPNTPVRILKARRADSAKSDSAITDSTGGNSQ